MPIFVDTHVLVYAISKPVPAKKMKAHEAAKLAQLQTAAKLLFGENDVIAVSAISVLEVMRGLTDDERPAFEALTTKLRIEAVTGPVAIRADALLRARGQKEKLCRRCLGSTLQTPCTTCQANVSRQQRLNDALILATADELQDVDLAYSEDSGVQDLAGYATAVRVEPLPNPNGPLFAQAAQKEGSPGSNGDIAEPQAPVLTLEQLEAAGREIQALEAFVTPGPAAGAKVDP
jgi:predicted nucleic acid-binding protein